MQKQHVTTRGAMLVAGIILLTSMIGATRASNHAMNMQAIKVSADISFDTVLPWLYAQGLTKYQTNAEFRGDDEITRGEAAKFVNEYATVLGLEKNYTSCVFGDIAGYDQTLTPHIGEACAYGLLKGSNSQFSPNGKITLAQGITIVVRALVGFQDETGMYWYQEYYNLGKELGIITDEALTTLDSINITREQLGTWFYLAAQAHENMMDDEMMDDEIMDEEMSALQGLHEYSAEKLSAGLAANQHVILYFHADWCPSCQAFKQNLTENIANLPSDVLILEADYDTAATLKQEYGVTKQHTFLFLNAEGNVVGTNLVALTVTDLLEARDTAMM